VRFIIFYQNLLFIKFFELFAIESPINV